MQHSPQEIKTRLGEAVDPEGNVLNMAAVVEVIGLLERTPLTKEALEQTRIGRTVNLLRKKTENEDIARRAKKLVKKWQKLVQNHLEAVRNTNSPLNGLRCNSPLVNGLIKDEEKTVTESAVKAKQIDRKNKGIKRKRNSLDTPPPSVVNIQDVTGTKKEVDVLKEKKTAIDHSQDRSLLSGQVTIDSEENTSQKVKQCETGVSTDSAPSDGTNLIKRFKQVDDGESETVSDCAQKRVEIEQFTVEKTSSDSVLLCNEKTQNLDYNDVRWEGKDFSQQTEDLIEQRTAEGPQDPSTLPLDVQDKVNGINGRFGENGEWYAWSQTMPCNRDNLIVLPYVILD